MENGFLESQAFVQEKFKKKKSKNQASLFLCSANSAAAGQLTSRGPASPALRLQQGQGLAPAFENPSRVCLLRLVGARAGRLIQERNLCSAGMQGPSDIGCLGAEGSVPGWAGDPGRIAAAPG